jgi:hypothetical protein
MKVTDLLQYFFPTGTMGVEWIRSLISFFDPDEMG